MDGFQGKVATPVKVYRPEGQLHTFRVLGIDVGFRHCRTLEVSKQAELPS
jgi:hypothetical protein